MENIDSYYTQNTHDYMRCTDGAFADFIFASMSQVMGDDYGKYATAIELGAGMGRFSFTLVDHFSAVWLIEPAQAFAQTLREMFPQKHVRIVDTTAEAFFASATVPNDSIFFCFHLLHHLSRQQRRGLFSFIGSAGASAVFVDPNPLNPLLLVQPFFDKDMRFKEEMQYLQLTRRRLSRELSACGMQVRAHAPLCLLPPFLAMKALRSRGGAEKLLRLERARRLLPFLGSYHFFYCTSGAPPAPENAHVSAAP
jgi:hypothetical protein